LEQTLLIIKPDAVERGLIGRIISRLEKAGFKISEMRLERLTEEKARRFYDIHREQPFYESLVQYMSSGPSVPMLLTKENAVADLRDLIGATDPVAAAAGTLRQEIGQDVQKNSVHASDSIENATGEIVFFFG
jgi:nucleoside-diphosphate kinase